MMRLKQLITRKPVSQIDQDSEESAYKRTLTVWDLVSIGVGGIIGAGIFVLTGKAAKNNAGPAIVLSYIIAGFVSALASLCYAELASSLPVSGSAYSFTYATMGELLAWIIGWDLMLEYLVGGATVASGWSAYLGGLQGDINSLSGSTYVFDPRFVNAPLVFLEGHAGETVPCNPWNQATGTGENVTSAGFFINCVEFPRGSGTYTPAILNVPAVIISLTCTALLLFGIKESASVNNTMVITKLLVVLIVVFAGIKFVNPSNYAPFIPPSTGESGQYGLGGVLTGAVSVFFAYIGFDSVSTVAQESKNPQRDLPIGIIGSLFICTILYIAVAAIITGMVPYKLIDESHAVSAAFSQVGLPGLSLVIGFGALAGLTSVLLNSMIGQPRIFQSMASDGLFPSAFAKIGNRGTPYVSTLTTGVLTAVLSGLLPVDILGNLTSIGTLFAFFLVSLSTAILRYTDPDLPRKFKIGGPAWFGYLIPLLSAAASIGLMTQSTVPQILRVLIWLAIGLVFYALFGFWYSKVGRTLQEGKPLGKTEKPSETQSV